MTIEELRQRYKQADETDERGPGYITLADVAEWIEPGLAWSTSPTAAQCRMLGEMAGYVWRDEDDGWFRSATAETVAELLAQLCNFGTPVGVAVDIIARAMQVGANEYSG